MLSCTCLQVKSYHLSRIIEAILNKASVSKGEDEEDMVGSFIHGRKIVVSEQTIREVF